MNGGDRDRVVLVTGGSQGIGAETVRLALAAGHRTIALGRDEGRLGELVERLDAGERLSVRAVDVADWAAVSAAVEAVVAEAGGIDAVVANAGTMAAGGFRDGDPEQWRTMVLTNLLGVANVVKATLPSVTERRGRYVILSSVLGRIGFAGSLYGATKHGVTALADNLRLELAGSGVGVTVVEPGITATPLWDEVPEPHLSAASVAETILWAIERPDGVAVNQLLVRHTDQPF